MQGPPPCKDKDYSFGVRERVWNAHRNRTGYIIASHLKEYHVLSGRSQFCLAPAGAWRRREAWRWLQCGIYTHYSLSEAPAPFRRAQNFSCPSAGAGWGRRATSGAWTHDASCLNKLDPFQAAVWGGTGLSCAGCWVAQADVHLNGDSCFLFTALPLCALGCSSMVWLHSCCHPGPHSAGI